MSGVLKSTLVNSIGYPFRGCHVILIMQADHKSRVDSMAEIRLVTGLPSSLLPSYALSGLRLKVHNAVALRAFGILQARAQIFEVASDLLLRAADVPRFNSR